MTADLPRWDLSDLYAAPDAPALLKDKEALRHDVKAFHADYYGKLLSLDAQDLATSITRYESIEDGLGKISSYADLLFATYSTDPLIAAACQDIQDYVTQTASDLVFYTLELNLIDDVALNILLKADTTLQHYAPWLRDVRAFKPYQLDERLEQLMLDKASAANQSWVRLYEDISNRMKVTINGAPHGLTEALDLLSHPQEAHRKDAAFALSGAFEREADKFALIFNTIIKDKAVDDRWRGFKYPVSSRNVANLIEDNIVETLSNTVKARYNDLSVRYYGIKASMLGKDALDYWDRNAPLPEDDDRTIPWDEAKQIVLQAYAAFSPELARLGQRFFDEHWIDVPVYEGKTSGAFSHPVTPSSHPYILLNYQGKIRDVMTLAHELGHGVHQLLAAHQGALMADTPLTLAETASVFGEQLTFQYMVSQEKDPKKRRLLIASKIEDMLSTVVRQIAFYQFESRLHEARKAGELSVDAISQHWMDVMGESFGDAIRLDPSYRFYWTYVSHFYHAPFYVYAYAFGDCLVNSLYAVYEEERHAGRAEIFEAKYIEMLRAGGSLRHKELLAPFNLDISQPDFWHKGLDHISRMIDML